MRDGPIFVELLDRSDAIQHRLRFDALPIRIGRDYGNDVIVDDPYLAATHVVIDVDEHGALLARDAGSRNGIHAALGRGFWLRASARRDQIELAGHTVIRAGHTSFRVRRADHVVPPERLDTTSYGWEGTAPAIMAIILLALVSWHDAWTSSSSEQMSTHYAGRFGLVFGCLLAWAGLWAILNRLFGGRARFGRHLLVAAAVLFGIELATQLFEQTAYSFSVTWLARYQVYLLYGLIAVAVYFHMLTMRPLSVAQARNVAIAFALVTTGLLGFARYSSHQTVEYAAYVEALRWPASRVSANMPSDNFVKQAANMTVRVDARRGNAPAADEDDD